jgi:hypothetical protein
MRSGGAATLLSPSVVALIGQTDDKSVVAPIRLNGLRLRARKLSQGGPKV